MALCNIWTEISQVETGLGHLLFLSLPLDF